MTKSREERADEHDQRKAFEEGWGVFQVDARLTIMKLDDPDSVEPPLDYNEPKFKSDTDAIIFVALKAHEGSLRHRAALDMIGELA